MNDPRLLPMKVVARMAVVHVQTIRRAFRDGEIDGVRIRGVVRIWWPLRSPAVDHGEQGRTGKRKRR